MVDTIIGSRNKEGECQKVTIVTHSTGANQSLVAATDSDLQLSRKVAKIVNLGPCLAINIEKFWLPVRDLASIRAFYDAHGSFGITNLFGYDTEENISGFCNSGGVNGLICNAYLKPAMQNTLLRRTSLKDFQHVQQNTAVSKFRAYVEDGSANPANALELPYDLENIQIPVHVFASQTDQACPYTENMNRYKSIPMEMLQTETLMNGEDHLSLLNNDLSFLTQLYAAMPAT